MDFSTLGYRYQLPTEPVTPRVDFGAAPEVPAEFQDSKLKGLDLGEKDSGLAHRWNNDKLEFLSAGDASARPFVSLQFKNDIDPVTGERHSEMGKIRSPYLSRMAQDLAKSTIAEPLQQAWEERSLNGEGVRALAWGSGLLAAAVMSPTETKSRVDLMRQNVGDYTPKHSLSVVSGHGDIDIRSAKVSLAAPARSNAEGRWNLDLEYRLDEKEYGLGFSRQVSRVQVGPSEGVSYLQMGVSKNAKSGTTASLSYHLGF